MTSYADCRYGLVRTVDPAAEPVSDEEALAWLRLSAGVDDPTVTTEVKAARDLIERLSGLAICTQTWKLYLDRFPAWEIRLPRSPLISVTSIAYVDPSGNAQTMSASLYTADETVQPGRVTPVWGGYWPATRCQPKAVTITFVAGFGAPAAVPEGVKKAVKVMSAWGYENRGEAPAELPGAVLSLLGPYLDGRCA